jgi:HAD superfamily hydrolase (TIGR01509 family)
MPLELPPGDFAAYLFDCDGTVADSMPLHYIAWKQALAEYGVPFPEDLFYALGGLPVPAVVERLTAGTGIAIPIDTFAHRKEALYYELLPQLKAVPEVLEQVHAAHGKIPFAVVSGSTRESVTLTLEALGLLAFFDTLVCAGDYTHGKPDPEPFLLAAAQLGVAPANCLVFEDAEPGIQSAIAAGMAWVRIPHPRERLAAGKV